MSKEQFQPKVMEVTTLFDSDLAEYEYMQEQEAAKKAKGLADAIYTNCPACILEEEAEMIARFVIEEQGYCKQSEVIDEFANLLKEKLHSVPTVYKSHFGRLIDDVVKTMKGGAE